jgi:CDGSH-type Zn-finger protein
MPRLIRLDATGPIRIDPQDKPVFICGCGLSQNFPFCDGAHKGCKDEQPDTLYVYDAERKTVVEERADG